MTRNEFIVKSNSDIFNDFVKYSKLSLAIWDNDPSYPILKKYYELSGMTEKQKHWHVLLYLTFYRLTSAEAVFEYYPNQEVVTLKQWYPTDYTRRGLRGDKRKQEKFINQFAGFELDKLVRKLTADKGKLGWFVFEKILQKNFWYVGTWTTYKWADLLQYVFDFDIKAPDLSNGGGKTTTGPVAGLMKLFDIPKQECDEELGIWVYNEMIKRGVEVRDNNTLETLLCDFKAMCAGKYYVGHDIDSFLNEITLMENEGVKKIYMEARKQTLNEKFLGEYNGWEGIRPELRKLYQRNKQIKWWA
jgi:hypothetical protein